MDIMPHVVLVGDVVMDEVFREMKSLFMRNEKGILKTESRYMDSEKNAILIESLVIEGGTKRAFLAMVSKREDGLVVRIYPRLDIEKSDGVKSLLANIAKQLLQAFPALKVGETNLSEYLK